MRRYVFTYYPSTREWKDGDPVDSDLLVPSEVYEVYAGTRFEAFRLARTDRRAAMVRERKQAMKERRES